ncbi:thioredoxin-like protein CITRX, chloroplastic [Physcomitrium patens]|uniref:Thioredoxin domain-containing protein n=1 Tax=Physcomitrium patens TaxID=3218 RepID=A0A2K1KQ80_PHYPA|nr:thioredoxin-like protein CITRX, chloroplastic [Physcomitrium patens]PNR55930.1 hypothetical protein PHYPA_006827 [Physcomitrium patens]|eukprot:XP_024374331.1 thioredoxin-like protein CITRX, chloroplastic [Physcomitrella patens]
MAATASMSSLTSASTSYLSQRVTASRAAGHGIFSKVSPSDQNSSFFGVRLWVRGATQPNDRNLGVGFSIRAASGAKGDHLVRKVTARELDDILANERDSPMVVDFYATWCGPCALLAQQLEQLAMEYGDRVRFLKIDTDEEHELADQMKIRGLPTMVFVSQDTEKLAIRTEGLLSSKDIRDIIEKELDAPQGDLAMDAE